MKRALGFLLSLVLTVGLVTATSVPAEAKKKRDTPGCVTRAEYRSVTKGTSNAKVAQVFDTWGRQRFSNDHGYFVGQWFDYGQYESQFVVTGGHVDEFGEWVEDGYYEDVWVPNLYWDDSAHWVPMVDSVRTYKKCRSFEHGRGRVAINYDNYSRARHGMRLAFKHPRKASFMDLADHFRQGGRIAGKTVPQRLTKATAPKPAPRPTLHTNKPLGEVRG